MQKLPGNGLIARFGQTHGSVGCIASGRQDLPPPTLKISGYGHGYKLPKQR